MIRTERLLLRQWRDDDLPAFAAMNADPVVREFFDGLQDRAASDASAEGQRAHIDAHGFGFWAAEAPGLAPFIGFVGISHAPDYVPFAPAVEIGWRLARPWWGMGLATEGARAALDQGFRVRHLPEILSWAVATNQRSISVMERIGMRFAGKFDHPRLPEGDRNRPHVLYRIAAPA